jgi:hypothetical protein
LGSYEEFDNDMMLSFLLALLLMPGAAVVETGSIEGSLRLPNGKPGAGVRVGVEALPGPGRGGDRGAARLIVQTLADASGKYRLEDVPIGRYHIVAGRVGAPTYYPGVLDSTVAKVIEVRAKQTVRNISFEVDSPLLPGRGGSPRPAATAPPAVSTPPPPPPRAVSVDSGLIAIKGRVILKGDTMAPQPAALTFGTGPADSTTSALANVRADGTFSLHLKPGDQALSLNGLPDGYSVVSITSGSKDLRAGQLLHVEPDVEIVVTLNAEARPRFRVLGRVIDDTTERSLAGEQVELVLPTGETTQTTVDARGMVTFNRLFRGTYFLRLVSPRLEVPEKKVVITNSSVEVELRAREKR